VRRDFSSFTGPAASAGGVSFLSHFYPLFSMSVLSVLLRRGLSVLLLVALRAGVAAAQAALLSPPIAGQAYDFATITVVESPYKNDYRLLLSPAFQGKTEVKLEEEYNLSSDRYREHLQSNTAVINQTLSDLSTAGWELLQVSATTVGPPPAAATVTRYLLRKAKS
jgi:hypothetical protein